MKLRLWLILIAICFTALPNGRALAHAEFVSSSPADGETVAGPIKEISQTFGEDIQPFSSVQITDQAKNDIKPDQVEIAGKKMTAIFDKPLDQGVYEVQWQAVADDGHTSKGSYSFTISNKREAGTAGEAAAPANQGRSGLKRFAPAAAVVIVILLLAMAFIMLKAKRK